jgi:hypothetical protein
MTVLNRKAPVLNRKAPLNEEAPLNREMRGSMKARLGLYIRGLYIRTLHVQILAVLLLAAPFIASVISPAQAAMFRLGEVDVQVDATMSMGASVLTEERDMRYVPVVNGGPADKQEYHQPVNNGMAFGIPGQTQKKSTFVNCTATDVANYGTFCQRKFNNPNFDGSINTDDGRLNFNKDDVISAPLKLTSEIEAASGAWTGFARIAMFYDMRLMDEGSFERGGLNHKGQARAGRNLELLDFYVDYDGDIGDMPFTVRLGRQVINWGEATFIPGGNSAFNPIDVAALRRPGAEIKEALLPVEALYTSLALTEDLTIEAYAGGWDDFRLDPGGTAFGASDAFTPGSLNGNPYNVYFIGGGTHSGQQFACDTAALTAANMNASAAIAGAVLATGAIDCANNPNMDVRRGWTRGLTETERWRSGDTNIVRGLANEEGDKAAGLAVRWYSEALNSTEFAFYYQKADSRLPYISYRTGKMGITASSIGPRSSEIGRGAGIAGCLGIFASTNPALRGKLYNPAHINTKVNDKYGLLTNATIQTVANGTASALGYTRGTLATDSVAYLQETNCLTYLAQRDITRTTAVVATGLDAGGQLPTGATNLQMDYNIDLFGEFPEIETYGLSFNTTVLGWGVQGDFTYRPEVPLQFDTDALTISALFNNCAFATVGVLEPVYQSGATYANEFADDASREIGCTDKARYMQGWTEDHDAWTWDIGTTATFTRSNPVVGALGSDLGIFLTEFQGVIVEDIEEKRGNTGGITALGQAKGITPLSNVCTAGSDLPLNGILAIDDRTQNVQTDPNDDNPKGYCRPTDNSWGLVVLAQLQYNNVFGTPISLNPTLVYTVGMEGYSPSPIGFWREDVGSTAFSLNARYLDSWQGSLSYRTYHGDAVRTKNLDRDTLSLSISYAF